MSPRFRCFSTDYLAAHPSRDKNLFLASVLYYPQVNIALAERVGASVLSPLSRAIKIDATRCISVPCCFSVVGNDARRWTRGKLTFWIIKFSISIAISRADVRSLSLLRRGRRCSRWNHRQWYDCDRGLSYPANPEYFSVMFNIFVTLFVTHVNARVKVRKAKWAHVTWNYNVTSSMNVKKIFLISG